MSLPMLRVSVLNPYEVRQRRLTYNDPSSHRLGVEKDLGVAPPPLLSEHPSSSMFEAAKRLIQTHARRLPLLDLDSDTGHEVIVSVLTTYRLLKFISINVRLSPFLRVRYLTWCDLVSQGGWSAVYGPPETRDR
jgi:hypothetical protein